MIFAAALLVPGLAGFVWFLTGEGLDDAEKWVSIVGMCVSICLSVAGLVVAWLTWRQSLSAASPRQVHATGGGSTAIGGSNDGAITIKVSGVRPGRAASPGRGDVSATGDGSTAIGGDNHGDIGTEVTGPDQGGRP